MKVFHFIVLPILLAVQAACVQEDFFLDEETTDNAVAVVDGGNVAATSTTTTTGGCVCVCDCHDIEANLIPGEDRCFCSCTCDDESVDLTNLEKIAAAEMTMNKRSKQEVIDSPVALMELPAEYHVRTSATDASPARDLQLFNGGGRGWTIRGSSLQDRVNNIRGRGNNDDNNNNNSNIRGRIRDRVEDFRENHGGTVAGGFSMPGPPWGPGGRPGGGGGGGGGRPPFGGGRGGGRDGGGLFGRGSRNLKTKDTEQNASLGFHGGGGLPEPGDLATKTISNKTGCGGMFDDGPPCRDVADAE